MSAPHMPMMNDYGLLECPFCGCDDVSVINGGEGLRVECGDCFCRTDSYCCASTAMKKWNTRRGHLYTAEDFNQAEQGRE